MRQNSCFSHCTSLVIAHYLMQVLGIYDHLQTPDSLGLLESRLHFYHVHKKESYVCANVFATPTSISCLK